MNGNCYKNEKTLQEAVCYHNFVLIYDSWNLSGKKHFCHKVKNN